MTEYQCYIKTGRMTDLGGMSHTAKIDRLFRIENGERTEVLPTPTVGECWGKTEQEARDKINARFDDWKANQDTTTGP
jgi:hypothetical protein